MPVSRLKSVVLPAPFGPMRPYMSPRAMLNETLESACTPPKRLPMACASSNMVMAGHRLVASGEFPFPHGRRQQSGGPEQHHEHRRESAVQQRESLRLDEDLAEERLLGRLDGPAQDRP